MKLYFRSRGPIVDQAKAYLEVFGGKIVKQSFVNQQNVLDSRAELSHQTYDYIYLHLATGDKIMLAAYQQSMPTHGYQLDLVIEFDNPSFYYQTYEKLTKHRAFKVDYPMKQYPWNTLAKFYDQWGYGWILELRGKGHETK